MASISVNICKASLKMDIITNMLRFSEIRMDCTLVGAEEVKYRLEND